MNTRRSFLASIAALIAAPLALAATKKAAPIQDITRAGGTLVGPSDVVPEIEARFTEVLERGQIHNFARYLNDSNAVHAKKRRHLHHGHPRRGNPAARHGGKH